MSPVTNPLGDPPGGQQDAGRVGVGRPRRPLAARDAWGAGLGPHPVPPPAVLVEVVGVAWVDAEQPRLGLGERAPGRRAHGEQAVGRHEHQLGVPVDLVGRYDGLDGRDDAGPRRQRAPGALAPRGRKEHPAGIIGHEAVYEGDVGAHRVHQHLGRVDGQRRDAPLPLEVSPQVGARQRAAHGPGGAGGSGAEGRDERAQRPHLQLGALFQQAGVQRAGAGAGVLIAEEARDVTPPQPVQPEQVGGGVEAGRAEDEAGVSALEGPHHGLDAGVRARRRRCEVQVHPGRDPGLHCAIEGLDDRSHGGDSRWGLPETRPCPPPTDRRPRP